MLTVSTIATTDEAQAIATEWSELATSLHPRLPFHSPEWAMTWWKYFRRENSFARDHLRIQVIRDDAGQLIAIAPMMLTQRPGRGPARTRELQFLGADKNITELRGPICAPERVQEVLEALRRHVATVSEHDWVQWCGIRQGEEASAGQGLGEVDPALCKIDYLIAPGPCWETFRSGLPRNIKESLRKCFNSLRRDGHLHDLRVTVAPEEAGPAIERFLALHHARAAQDGTIPHPDVFDRPEDIEFLKAICLNFARNGQLQIFELVVNGNIVASRIGFLLGRELYLYYSGYDQQWRRYSVMTTTVAEAIRWAIAQGCTFVNLSTGTDVSKTRWRPQQIAYSGGYEVANKVFSRTVFEIFRYYRQRTKPALSLPNAQAA